MKTSRIFLLIAGAIIMMIASCGKESPAPTPVPDLPVKETDKITLSGVSEVVCSQESQTKSISFVTNTAWSATCAVNWCTLSPSSGKAGNNAITVSVSENEGYDERNCALVIKAGTASTVVNFFQKQKDALILTSNQFQIGAEGGTLEIPVSANVEPEVSISEDARFWITHVQTKALQGRTLVFSIAPAEENIDRTGTITISGDGKTQTVTIRQYQPSLDNPVHFASEAFKQYCVNEFDRNADGEVSFREALDVEWIGVQTDKILSLEGIEAFTNLKYLGASGASARSGGLEDLDLSNNEKLIEITVHDNRLRSLVLPQGNNLRQLIAFGNNLTSLDLSSCKQVEMISVGGNGSLSVLSLPEQADKLKDLHVNDNNLSQVDISAYAGLEVFLSYGNPMRSLDVRNNAALKELLCSDERLEVLFVKEDQIIDGIVPNRSDAYIHPNTVIYTGAPSTYQGRTIEITDPVLREWLRIHYDKNGDGNIGTMEANAIESIDMVSTEVESLEGIQYMPNLKVLRVSGNESYDQDHCGKIKEVDLSGNPNLEWIGLNVQQLQSIDLSKTPKLKHLSIWGNEIKHLDLSVTPLLEGADIASNKMTDVNLTGLDKVGSMYMYGNAFESVDLSFLRNADFLALDWCDQLKEVIFPENAKLKTFSCKNSAIEKLDVSTLPNLEELLCSSERTQFLYVREGQQLNHITTDRDAEYIHPNTVIITGSAKDDHLIVEKTYFELGPDGGQISIPIVADNEVKVTTDVNWISRPDGTVFKTGTLVLDVASMPRGTSRSAKVKLQAGSKEVQITVCQTNEDWVAVNGISLGVTSITLSVGESYQMMATVSPDNATDKTVTWSSSDSGVATVDKDGLVTALKGGGATITAVAGKQSASCNIVVVSYVPVTSITIDRASATMTVGEHLQLTAMVTPLNATEKEVHWMTLNSSVASVNDTGLVTATGEGTTTIVAECGGMSAECLVFIEEEGVLENEIWYTTTDNSIITIKNGNDALVANTYENGQGRLKFNGTIYLIPNGMFREITTLQSIRLPQSIVKIEDDAFIRCTNLSVVDLSIGIKEIGRYAFYDCQNLKEIELPDRLTKIGDYAFNECRSLPSIKIPKQLNSLGSYAFACCRELSSLTIEDSSVNIDMGRFAFAHCDALISVFVPSRIQYLRNSAFEGCQNLQRVILAEGITGIGTHSFYQCPKLSDISLPQSITTLESASFQESTSLTEITIPEKVKAINPMLFKGCSALKTVTLSAATTYIGDEAFYGCTSLREITISKNVNRIDKDVFAICRSLEKIVLEPTTPPLKTNGLYEDTTDAKIYVPSVSLEAYKTADGWRDFAYRIFAAEE